MRTGLAAAVLLCVPLAACHLPLYDPVDELEFRVYPDTASAVRAILGEVAPPRVYAVGEYHPTRAAAPATSPLARFTDEIIGLLEPHAQHLVIEAWLDDNCRGGGPTLGAQVASLLGRPSGTPAELSQLVEATARRSLAAHALPLTCIEQSAMLDAGGRVDLLRLLETITVKLREAAWTLVEQGRDVIVYGGALHNDLYPRYPFEELSYAPALGEAVGTGGVLELDLVVPELVAPMDMVRAEAWFPLLARTAPDRTLVWMRAPDSYVLLLPAQTAEAGSVARPRRR